MDAIRGETWRSNGNSLQAIVADVNRAHRRWQNLSAQRVLTEDSPIKTASKMPPEYAQVSRELTCSWSAGIMSMATVSPESIVAWPPAGSIPRTGDSPRMAAAIVTSVSSSQTRAHCSAAGMQLWHLPIPAALPFPHISDGVRDFKTPRNRFAALIRELTARESTPLGLDRMTSPRC
jgi:hypothetical protein